MDRLIDYLGDDRGKPAPFFAVLSFTAPHWPLQAPDAAIAKYAGRYDQGYDVIAERRLKRMKELGLVPASAERSARSPKERPWDELSEEGKRIETRAMEVYAAMIDQVDVHTGRLLDYLESAAVLDDTLILFLSDNGAEGHDLDETWPADMFPAIRKTIDDSHDFSFEAMGRPGSYVLYGANWANAGSPPYKLHKAFPTEGGARTTAFVHFPKALLGGVILDDLISVKDVLPTLLELTGVEHPGSRYRGQAVESPSGISVLSVLQGTAQVAADRVLVDELLGKRSVRQGDWKLVHMPEPYGTGDWQLYNVAEDLAERRDLAERHPNRVAELAAHWDRYAEANGVIIPNWVSGY